MRRASVTEDAKGWLAGPWDGRAPIPVGFATEGVDEPHVHTAITEVYLVARGSSLVRVETDTVELTSGDVLILAPGEAHTFLSSSDDYLHFVVHVPGPEGADAGPEKEPVARSRLAL